jgi:SnoaL-like domain
MDFEITASAQRAADRYLVEDLTKRYAQGIDRRDWAAVDRCFSPEARVEGTRFRGAYPEYISNLRPSVERFRTTMHYVTNQLTEFTGETTAHVVTYAMAFHLGSDTDDFVIGVRYLDDVERKEGDWWITKRIVEGVWQRPLAGQVQELT